MDRHLWLIGMMGSGKTAVAAELGVRWDVPSLDTDAEVVKRTGCSIGQLWGERGEEAFRDMEAAAVRRIAGKPASVVATGGGAVLDDGNVAAMRGSGSVVWLSAPPEILSARVGSGKGRPLLEGDSSEIRLAEILKTRSPLYSAASDFALDIGKLSVPEVADKVEAWWNGS
jgi:shikimate kinase